MNGSKEALYRDLLLQVQGILTDIRDPIANAANVVAVLWYGLPDLNWAGFYFARSATGKVGAGFPKSCATNENGDALLLGPFQGKPACVRIAIGKGVCGTAAATRKTVIVPDVHAFDGHIACDSASNSEIVVPLLRNGAVAGVLDLDSPSFARFDAADAAGLEAIANAWIAGSDAL